MTEAMGGLAIFGEVNTFSITASFISIVDIE
jgi:hypothetical protein